MAKLKIVAATLFRWGFLLVTALTALGEGSDAAMRIVCALFAVACWFDWRLVTGTKHSPGATHE